MGQILNSIQNPLKHMCFIAKSPCFHRFFILVGGLEHDCLWLSIQLGISSSQLTNSYFSEGLFYHQPAKVFIAFHGSPPLNVLRRSQAFTRGQEIQKKLTENSWSKCGISACDLLLLVEDYNYNYNSIFRNWLVVWNITIVYDTIINNNSVWYYNDTMYIYMYYPVGGLEPIYNFYDFPIILGMSSSQLTNSYFSEGLKPPTRQLWWIIMIKIIWSTSMMIFMIIMVNNTDSGIIIRGLDSLLALLYSIRGL